MYIFWIRFLVLLTKTLYSAWKLNYFLMSHFVLLGLILKYFMAQHFIKIFTLKNTSPLTFLYFQQVSSSSMCFYTSKTLAAPICSVYCNLKSITNRNVNVAVTEDRCGTFEPEKNPWWLCDASSNGLWSETFTDWNVLAFSLSLIHIWRCRRRG